MSDAIFWSEVERCVEDGETVVVAKGRVPRRAIDDERRDAVRYAIVRRMNVDEFKHLYIAAQTRGARFDDLVSDQAPKFLGRTFEQELSIRGSLDVAEATL